MRGACLSFLLLLVACNGGASPGGSGGSGDDTGPGGDGGGGDTGAPAGLLPLTSACSNILPIDHAGVQWTWSFDGDPYQGQVVWTALGQQSYQGESAWALQMVTSSHYAAAPENTQDQTDVAWYRCDDQGAWLLGRGSHVHTVDSGKTYDWDTVYEYPDPGVIAPHEVAAGDSWSYDFTILYQSGDGYSDSVPYQVVGTSTQTVEAGTFDCLRITTGGIDEVCAAPGVGNILTAETALASVVGPSD